jgi:hypothetical protein
MNYLTHYLVDHKPGNPPYNFGLALPDLVNTVQRGWKPAKENNFANADVAVKEIWLGYQQHIAADARFHNLPIFTEETRRLRLELEKAGLDVPGVRLFFTAHVLLELLIDRHIVKTRAQVAALFYEHIESIKETEIEAFFTVSGTSGPSNFFEFFTRFRESRYLLKYSEDLGLLYAINRLQGRTGQPTYTSDEQKTAFSALVAQEEAYLYDIIEKFFEEQGVSGGT